MKAARLLKAKVAAGQITTGALATDLLWPGLVECLMRADLDYLIIDQEHGAHAAAHVGGSLGMVNQNVLPTPGSESTPSVPPWRCTARLAWARPIPVPS